MSKAREVAKLGEVMTNGQIGGRRNIIINGAMKIAQRATSASSITTTGYHTVDRFKPNINTMGTYTISQSTTAPIDFTTSLKIHNTVTVKLGTTSVSLSVSQQNCYGELLP